MRLGGTIVGEFNTPEDFEKLLIKSRFRAITAPFTYLDSKERIDSLVKICEKNDVLISEIGVWRNTLIPENLEYAKGQLRLADELGIECCVNIAGTLSSLAWDAADYINYTKDTYDMIVDSVRSIIDDVDPTRSFYCLEPMPWMLPDGPDEYLKLIKDIDRKQFAVHMDFVNMINSPRRFLCSLDFIEECMSKLGPSIKSTHIKDSKMDLTAYTTHVDECPPGQGMLDYPKVLKILEKYLPENGAILLEHMNTFEDYEKAYDYVYEAAQKANVEV